MNPKLKTIFLWSLPIILIIGLSWQLLSNNNIDTLKSNGTTIAPKNRTCQYCARSLRILSTEYLDQHISWRMCDDARCDWSLCRN